MKRLLFLLVLIQMTCLLFGQVNVFTMNNGSALQNRDEAWMTFKRIYEINIALDSSDEVGKSKNTLPIIYHRVINGDTIINFYQMRSYVAEKKIEMVKDFIFEQDSLFLLIGKRFPNIDLVDINESPFTFDCLKGKPTLINLNGTYCKACLSEIPSLNKLKEKYEGKVNFISIFDIERKPGDIERILENKTFNFTILKNNKSFKSQLGIKNIPQNIFIDKDGIVRYVQTIFDYNTNTYFDKILDELLKKQ